MKPLIGLTLLCLAFLPRTGAAFFNPEASVVQIEVTKQTYDYGTPWITRNQQIRKNGILIGDKQILTTADGLDGQYLCRVRKGGESRQYTAELVWVDFYGNIALLEVDDAEFWEDMKPVALARTIPQSGDLQIYRWRGGRIEQRAGEIVRLSSGKSKMSYLHHLVLTVSSSIQSAGWSEVVFDEDQLVGLTVSMTDDRLNVLPAEFIARVIELYRTQGNPGLGYFDFNIMSGRNPALMASKGLDQRDIGVVVTEVGSKGLADNSLEVGDIILEVDGFVIDSGGMYIDPEYGRLSMRSLATRAHAAGESIPFKVWREGAAHQLDYLLPRADFEQDLVPDQRYDLPPQYLVAGGLVFQPLNGPLLQALGNNKPPLLEYYSQQKAVGERTGLVVLSGILPDNYNLGYEDIRFLLVDEVNGQEISTLEDIEAALAEPDGAFHRIRFMPEGGLRHVVLDAETMQAATLRILQNYRIPAQSQF